MPTHEGLKHSWILRVDQRGKLVKSKCYGGRGTDIPLCLLDNGNGTWTMSGQTDSFLIPGPICLTLAVVGCNCLYSRAARK
jgi:hypothetical protein